MARGGFALITVLWVIAALGMLVTAGLSEVDLGRRAAENRMHLARTFWAGQACLAIMQARYDGEHPSLVVDSTDLGRSVWCAAQSLDPSARVHLNATDSVGLLRALGDAERVASLLDWIDPGDEPRPLGAEADWYRARGRPIPRNGPLADLKEVRRIRGFEGVPLAELERFLTVRGDGRVNPNRAPPQVLKALPVLPPSGIQRIVSLRAGGRTFGDAEDIVSAAGVRVGAAEFRELTRRTVFDGRHDVVRVVAGVRVAGRLLTTTITASVLVLEDRLAIRRTEVR